MISYKIFALALLSLFVLAPAHAITIEGAQACRDSNQRFDAATYVFANGQWEQQYQRPGYKTTVEGDSNTLAWQSNRQVKAVLLISEGGITQVDTDTRSGTVLHDGAEALVLCLRGSSSGSRGARSANSNAEVADENPEFDQPEEVPEMSTVLLVAVGILGAGFIARKRN